MIIFLFALSLFSFSATLQAGTESSYQGQQHREIKALSESEINGYLTGQGMGFAKAAELNHYPGPVHVLDVASELKLDTKQLQKTQALFEKMQTKAVALGKKLVDQEKELDQLFAQNKVTNKSLNDILQEISVTRAKLRYVHLSAHLEQKQILSNHQIMLYDQLRGYSATGHANSHDGQQHNHSH